MTEEEFVAAGGKSAEERARTWEDAGFDTGFLFTWKKVAYFGGGVVGGFLLYRMFSG